MLSVEVLVLMLVIPGEVMRVVKRSKETNTRGDWLRLHGKMDLPVSAAHLPLPHSTQAEKRNAAYQFLARRAADQKIRQVGAGRTGGQILRGSSCWMSSICSVPEAVFYLEIRVHEDLPDDGCVDQRDWRVGPKRVN